MSGKGFNRFALLDEGDDSLNTPRPVLGTKKDPNAKPALDLDAGDWQEVKSRGAQPKKTGILVIHDENKPPPHARGRQSSKPLRRISNGTAEPPSPLSPAGLNESDKHFNQYENWCGVCNHRFANKTALQSHVKQSPNHQNYCNLCKRVFKDRNGLQNHVDHATGHDVFCNLCLSAFNDKWGLRNHFENNYSVGHEFACLTCLKGFESHEKMETHLRTAPKHVSCNTCHVKFKDQDARDEHWRNTTKHKHCLQPGCDFDGRDAAQLEKHIQEDHFLCAGCHLVFPSATKLSLHLESCGLTKRCSGCDRSFPAQDLEAHRISCFPCQQCSYWTDIEEDFNKHVNEHNKAVENCYLCSTPMQTQTLLIKHLETGKCPHIPDPAFLTRLLGRWWYSALYMDLDIHAQIRQGRLEMKEMMGWMKDGVLDPYMCRAGGCGKTFSRFSSLVFHAESGECEWDVAKLGLDRLEKEVKSGLRT
ncbi:hypothetical protein K491DRAFT_588063 [Lophiostoma macrostomum CBS 122681]|uniref:C2H2-type domain-containing protein n=1 Tax=Lophiostoma macrostomum CBS 122681 TaxID=1314788 RepID=A0A6A6TQP7_9PLEO|nr:hypothetical protein K491DRAFT_588063 [Lophiostoma macrostomum CBS 122681]